MSKRRFRRRNEHGTSGLSEFIASFAVLIPVLFPLVDMIGVALGFSATCFLAFRAVTAAAYSRTFASSLQEVKKQSDAIVNSGIGRFVKLTPVGGWCGSGCNLSIMATNIYSGKSQTFPANSPPTLPLDTTSNIYEFVNDACFDIGPAVSMAHLPLLAQIPGVGTPARVKVAWHRAVEHPEGLTTVVERQLSGGSSTFRLSVVTGIETPGQLTNTQDSGWNYPQLYESVATTGQTVVDEEVVTVQANNPGWTLVDTVAIQQGDRVWVDLRADGQWGIGDVSWDANGGPFSELNRLPIGALVGKMDSSPSVFLVGVQKWNYTPPGTGKLSLQFNYPSNNAMINNSGTPHGAVTVRVVVAR